MGKSSYQVLLYYKYVSIDDPEIVREEQRELCKRLNLKGRIIVAKEGINGTVEGLTEDTEKYIAAMNASEYFKDITFKKSEGTGNAFKKLSVKARSEIVTAGLPELNPQRTTGKYIDAEELHKWFVSGKEFYVVDMRNDFEYASGHFEGFIPSDMKHFSDLPKVLPKIKHLKNKILVTVCTGGIRCEKASGFLVENGFANVYQLKDGIVTYMEKYPNQHFKGKLYVFDNRITMGFNVDAPEHEVVGRCVHCGVVCDSYVNCEYNECHYHYIACSSCKDEETGFYFCDSKCKGIFIEQSTRRRLADAKAMTGKQGFGGQARLLR